MTYLEYEPLSLCPAPGWRALYFSEPDGSGPLWHEEPLAALAIYRIMSRPVLGEDAPVREHGNGIHGVVDCGGFFGPPEDISNFWRYASPFGDGDMGEPTEEEARKELARRAKLKAKHS